MDRHRPRAGLLVDGRYRLEKVIGEGGMAVVWSARHLKLNQGVAVKFLKKRAQPLKERFLREARVAAAIKHRHVVQVMDFGISGDWAYLVMEKLVGMTLAERLMDGPIPAVEAVRVTAQLLGGLSAVHDAKMAHRDLKPENIFLVEDADGTYPKIVDFGLSKRVGTSRDDDLRSVIPTSENLITGTPEYMSPEQARGLSDVDERTDTWSVAVLLFEMLTGEFPFQADAIGDLLVKIMTEDPPKLSDHRPDLGPRLEKFIHFGLMRDRETRYPNARTMRQALLLAVNQLASDLHKQGHGGAAKNMLRAVSSAYEPGDSGLVFAPKFKIDFDDSSDGEVPFSDPAETARQVRDREGRPVQATVAESIESDALDGRGEPIPTIEAQPDADLVSGVQTLQDNHQRKLLIGSIVVLLVIVGALLAIVLTDPDANEAPEVTSANVPDQAVAQLEETVDVEPEPTVEEPREPIAVETPEVTEVMTETEPELGIVRVELERVPPAASVFVNGVRTTSTLEIPRDGTRRLVVVRQPGRRAWSRNLTAREVGECPAGEASCLEEDTTLRVRLLPARAMRSTMSEPASMMGRRLFENAGF